MARARNVKPGLFSNEDLAECSIWARYIFPGLWMLADREGRLQDRPKKIKGELLPFDTVEVAPLLDELERYGFIARYAAGDIRVIQVVNFAKHQNPHHREAPSTLPSAESLRLQALETDTKPEADPPSHTAQASGQPPASLGLDAPRDDLQGGSNRADSLIPDSLIPDSLIPDSLIPDSGSLIADTGSPEAHQSADAPISSSTAPSFELTATSSLDQEKAPPRKARSTSFDAAQIDLPDWLERDLWSGWVAERKAKSKPITEAGAREQLKSLSEYREAGHTPERVIGHAIASGNQGLYPPPVIRSAFSPVRGPRQAQSFVDMDYTESAP